jgi:hypothetical protein
MSAVSPTNLWVPPRHLHPANWLDEAKKFLRDHLAVFAFPMSRNGKPMAKGGLPMNSANACGCCGGSTSVVGCDCSTCSTADRGVHLLGFDGPGVCTLLPTGINYFKVTGTIDFSDSIPILGSNSGPGPCGFDWEKFYSGTWPSWPASGLTVSYFGDSICTIPMAVAGGATSNPMRIRHVRVTYSCDDLNGPIWDGDFRITDNHFFDIVIGFIIKPATTLCSDTVTFSVPAGLGMDASVYGSGSAIVAAA